MRNVYFDMDGTLATWQEDKSIEEVASKGYFISLPPMNEVVKMVKRFIKMRDKDVNV